MADNERPLSPQGYVIGLLPTNQNPFWDEDNPPAGQGIPAGGTTGQVLTKTSDADYDADWQTPSGGSGTAGGYYEPAVDADGNLSWTPSDQSMPAVETVNIRGPQGPVGETGPQGPAGPGATCKIVPAVFNDGVYKIDLTDYFTISPYDIVHINTNFNVDGYTINCNYSFQSGCNTIYPVYYIGLTSGKFAPVFFGYMRTRLIGSIAYIDIYPTDGVENTGVDINALVTHIPVEEAT